MAILDAEGDDMVSVPEIRNRLQPVFTEPQADLLANVLVETHAELVTRGDFHRLTCTVEELAEAQKRTEHRVEQLAETQLEMQHAITELGTQVTGLTTQVTGLTRQVGDLAKQVGGLAIAVGANLEDFACELVPELRWCLPAACSSPRRDASRS
jgi:polyhydroxyalkanoate synthesis regulator phasin